MRIGNGYDVHRLSDNRKLILGGVHVPFEKGLLGHSDADVLTHAIIDALLGAAGLGDIGTLFPDTSDEYKDIDSLVLLKRTCGYLEEKGYKIINIDCIIVAQRPKLMSFIPEMRKKIEETIGTDSKTVNIKATTEETLGFTGAGLGISAYAVALIE